MFAKCSVLLVGFLEEVIQSNVRKIREQNTVITILNLDQIISATVLTAAILSRHFITWIFRYLELKKQEERW